MLNKKFLLDYNNDIISFFSTTNRHFLFDDVNEVLDFFENLVKKEYLNFINVNDPKKMHMHSVYVSLLENIHFIRDKKDEKIIIPETVQFMTELYERGHREVEKNQKMGMFSVTKAKRDLFFINHFKSFVQKLKSHNNKNYSDDSDKQEHEENLIKIYKNLTNNFIMKEIQFNPNYKYNGKHLLSEVSNFATDDILNFEQKNISFLKNNTFSKESLEKIKYLENFKLYLKSFEEKQKNAQKEIEDLFERSTKKIAHF